MSSAHPTVNVNPRTLSDLQWEHVRDRALALCQSDVGRDSLRARPVLSHLDTLRAELGLVDELRGVIETEGTLPPLSGLHDLSAILERARREGVLDGEELFAVADTLRAARLSRGLLAGHGERAPAIARLAHGLPDLDYLAHRLLDTFESDGSVRDDASPRLQDLRRQIAGLHERLRKQVVEELASRDNESFLQDDYYTMREDRYVLPIKASYKNAIEGIVHGSSNSGQTVYIEPESLIRTNNQLKVAEQEAEREMWRIRKECTALVSDEVEAIHESLALAARLDDLCARARLAQEMEASAPELVAEGPVRLRGARNPLLLLQGTPVVPNDVELDNGFSVLVITGPNTGGKTVTLSTVGLVTLMTQSGYLPPVGRDSRVRVYTHVASSMSEAQSLRDGLSAFSGHVLRVSRILEEAGPDSLVLLDEIMVGTEPSQGSALAVAFLEAYAAQGATVAVTTHYERLKTLSYVDERFRNASVGLDPERLTPNFRLSTGLPGSSSPIAVARRLGVQTAVLDRAEEVAGGEGLELEQVVRDLESERTALERERQALAAARRQQEEARERHEAERQRVKLRAEQMARQACAETLALTDRLRKELEGVRKIIRREDVTKKELEDARQQVAAAEKQARETAPPEKGAPAETPRLPLRFEDLAPGLEVWVESFGKAGRVAEAPRDERHVPVVMGVLRATVKLGDLRTHTPVGEKRAERRREAARRQTGVTLTPRDYDAMSPPAKVQGNTADLRGMAKDEALALLDTTLDAAVHEGGQAVWVLHGHGTGVLKSAVRAHLAASSYVTHFRPGERSEGGDGVTLAWVE